MTNRDRIMQAAIELFAAHGYDGVGVEHIVQTAGVTKPTLYHYFGSKRGLLETIVREQGENLLAVVEPASAYHHDLSATLTRLVTAYFDYATRHPVFYRMLLTMWFAPPSSEYFPAISDLQHRQYAVIEQLFLQAGDDHGNMRGRHQQYAVSLKGTMDTYIGLALQGYIILSPPDFVYRILHQFMHGIFS